MLSGMPAQGSDCISRMIKDSWRAQPLRSGFTVLQVAGMCMRSFQQHC